MNNNFELTGVCYSRHKNISVRGTVHMSEGDSFVLEAPVQHWAELLLVLGGELQDGDLLATVLLDVLQPHERLELRDGARGVQVSLGVHQQHGRRLQARLLQQLCDNEFRQSRNCFIVS